MIANSSLPTVPADILDDLHEEVKLAFHERRNGHSSTEEMIESLILDISCTIAILRDVDMPENELEIEELFADLRPFSVDIVTNAFRAALDADDFVRRVAIEIPLAALVGEARA